MKASDALLICVNILCFLINDLQAAPLNKEETKIQPNHSHLIPENVNLLKYQNSNIGVDGYDFA